MKRILLQYHIWEREYMILDILKQQLEERDVVVGYGDYMDIDRCLDFCPDIIVTHTIRTSTDATILSIIKLVTNAVLIPMTVEGYYDLDDLDSILSMIGLDASPIDLIDYYIMWGEKTKNREGEQLLKLHKISSIDKIRSFGYIPYEKEKVLAYAKTNEYYSEYIQWVRGYTRVIACITGFPCAEFTMENIYMENPFCESKGSDKYEQELRYYKKLLIFSREYREKYVSDIMQLAHKHPDIGIVVKLHPIEIKQYKYEGVEYYNQLRNYENIFLIDNEFPMSVILEGAEILVHYGSTMALEAYIYKVPSLLLYADSIDNSHLHEGNEKHIYTEKIHINDFEELERKIVQGIQFHSDKRTETILFDCFNWKPGCFYCPSEKIADFLNSDLHTTELQPKKLLSEGFVTASDLQGTRTQIYKRILASLLKVDIRSVKKYFGCIRRLVSAPSDLQSDVIRFIKKRLRQNK